MDYIAIIHKEADSDYGVSFPDFPGCITAGRSLEEAKDMAGEALGGHVEEILAAGETIPAASSLDRVMADPAFRDGVAFLVGVKPRGRTVRVNITMDEADLRVIDERARAQGLSRSAFLAAQALLPNWPGDEVGERTPRSKTRARPKSRPARGTNARLIAEVLRAMPSGTARPAEIRAVLERDKGVTIAFTSIRHALDQLTQRHEVAPSDDGKTWRYVARSA
jgi:predicted RNase H-like HicB family nuclease